MVLTEITGFSVGQVYRNIKKRDSFGALMVSI